MKKILLFVLLFFQASLFAKEGDWKFSPGFIFTNQKVYRGALYWPASSIFPFIGITYKKLSINGPGFNLTLPWNKFTYNLGISYFNDGPPLIALESHHKDFRNERKGVYDAVAAVTWEFLPRFRLSIANSKALNTHHGFYTALSLQIPLIPFLSTGYTLGYADGKANRYAYGPESRAGLGHRDFNLSLALPFLPGKGMLITKYTMSRIHLENNRKASFVRENDRPAILSMLATWTI